ncbi:MAG TPA: Asp23/Gls24 family envelope stress response protein [Ktedonobacteraceae bacterium]|nr:Asp23/Gls24 family envelope stress response protein [Ktedonobacteraceae bacterium]
MVTEGPAGSARPGVVRVARQVLLTIITNVTGEVPGVVRLARGSEQRARWPGRELPRDGITLTIKDNTLFADVYIIVAPDANIVEVGSAIQDVVASAIEEMVGMDVREVNVYIQDIAG